MDPTRAVAEHGWDAILSSSFANVNTATSFVWTFVVDGLSECWNQIMLAVERISNAIAWVWAWLDALTADHHDALFGACVGLIAGTITALFVRYFCFSETATPPPLPPPRPNLSGTASQRRHSAPTILHPPTSPYSILRIEIPERERDPPPPPSQPQPATPESIDSADLERVDLDAVEMTVEEVADDSLEPVHLDGDGTGPTRFYEREETDIDHHESVHVLGKPSGVQLVEVIDADNLEPFNMDMAMGQNGTTTPATTSTNGTDHKKPPSQPANVRKLGTFIAPLVAARAAAATPGEDGKLLNGFHTRNKLSNTGMFAIGKRNGQQPTQ